MSCRRCSFPACNLAVLQPYQWKHFCGQRQNWIARVVYRSLQADLRPMHCMDHCPSKAKIDPMVDNMLAKGDLLASRKHQPTGLLGCRVCVSLFQAAAVGWGDQSKHAARFQCGLGALHRRDRPGPPAQPHSSSCLHLNPAGPTSCPPNGLKNFQ